MAVHSDPNISEDQRRLATFQFRIVPPMLDEIPVAPPFRRPEGEYAVERPPEPEDVVWRAIDRWEALVRSDLQRLLRFRFGGDVAVRVRPMEVASIAGSITLLLAAGITMVNFLSKYKDFYESVTLLQEHLNTILERATQDVIQERYPGYAGGSQVTVDLEYAVRPPATAAPKARLQPPPFPRLLRPKNILRVFLGLVVIVFLLSQVPAFRNAVGAFWELPELRYRLVYLTGTQGNVENQGVLVVSNEGYGPAQDVYLHLMLAGEAIQSYQVVAQEPYDLRGVDLAAGEVGVWLDRLASGAFVELYFQSPGPLLRSDIRFSAVSDQGVAVPLHALLVRSAPADYEPEPSNSLLEFLYSLSDTETGRALYENYLAAPAGSTLRNPVFMTALALLAAAFLVAWIVWYFEAALAVAGLGVWLLSWWFFDAEVATYWLFALVFVVGFMLIAGMENERLFEIVDWFDERSGPSAEWMAFAILGALGLLWLFSVWWFWFERVPLTTVAFLAAGVLVWHARRVQRA